MKRKAYEDVSHTKKQEINSPSYFFYHFYSLCIALGGTGYRYAPVRLMGEVALLSSEAISMVRARKVDRNSSASPSSWRVSAFFDLEEVLSE